MPHSGSRRTRGWRPVGFGPRSPNWGLNSSSAPDEGGEEEGPEKSGKGKWGEWRTGGREAGQLKGAEVWGVTKTRTQQRSPIQTYEVRRGGAEDPLENVEFWHQGSKLKEDPTLRRGGGEATPLGPRGRRRLR